MCTHPSSCCDLSLQQFWKKWTVCLDYPEFLLRIELRLVTAAAASILRLTRFAGDEYELQLILSCDQLEFRRLDTSWSCLDPRRLDASYNWFVFWLVNISYGWLHLQLTRVPVAGYDASYRSFYPAAKSSSGGWIWVMADFIPWLTWVPAAGYKLQLTTFYGWLEFWRQDTT